MTGVTSADAGLYVCVVTNACDTSLSNAAVVELAAPPCPGDTNGDNVVNFTDLNTVLAAFGQTGQDLPGDLNADGVVNFLDLNEVLAAFGAACP